MPDRMRLSVQNLSCRRGGRQIFSGLDFTLAAGESLAVTGRNGAGKSSLLRMLAGLLTVAGGRIEFTGGQAERSLAEQAHYLGHQDALKPSLSVMENLEFWKHYLGGQGDSRIALMALGLESLARLPAAYLSAGQKRRLSISRLVAVSRPLWLLDEPTSSLDAGAQSSLLHLMQTHLMSGGMIIAATHAPLALSGVRELRIGAEA